MLFIFWREEHILLYFRPIVKRYFSPGNAFELINSEHGICFQHREHWGNREERSTVIRRKATMALFERVS